MGELYLRKVILEVIPQQGSGKKISGLRIAFRVQKTNEGTPNPAEIDVYGLSQQTRNLLEAKNTVVRLSFGYEGLKPNGIANTGFGSTSNVDLVFVGDVRKVTQEISRPDVITKIECADGENRYRNAKISKGYPANTKVQKVIDDLIASIGLSKGAQVGIPNKSYANGLSLSGPVRDQLDTICRSNDLEWSIQDGSIQIIPRNQTTSDQAILLTPNTGLIGSPSKTENGIEFESLIQPALKPGRTVKIESENINGLFKIRNVTHDGDSDRGTFLSKCEATAK